MKTGYGFTEFENSTEFKTWLNKQKVTRLQVHNTFLPDYSTWEKTDKKVFSEPHFRCTQSLNY